MLVSWAHIYQNEPKIKKSGRLGLYLCSAEYVKGMVRMYGVINLAVSQKVWRISQTLHQPAAPQNWHRPMQLAGVMSQ
jgi:hypothetical protein